MDTAPGTRPAARLAACAWLAAAASYLASEALAALAFSPRYSYARNFISDLGVPVCGAIFDGRSVCSPLHGLMNGDFVAQGVLFIVAAVAATRLVSTRARWALLACAVLNGIGIALVGLFPETAAASGIHALGALLAIVFGNATALASAFAFRALGLPRLHRVASLALPLLAAVAFATLLAARGGTTILVPDGIWERTSVYTITAWELLTAGCLLVWRGRRRTG